jgi:hypothetical protein
MCRSREIPWQAQNPYAITQVPQCRNQQQRPLPQQRRLERSAQSLLRPTPILPRRRHHLARHKPQRLPPFDRPPLRPDLRRRPSRLRSRRHQPRQRHYPRRLPKSRFLVPSPLARHLAQPPALGNLTVQRRHLRQRHPLGRTGPLSHPSHQRPHPDQPGRRGRDLEQRRF